MSRSFLNIGVGFIAISICAAPLVAQAQPNFATPFSKIEPIVVFQSTQGQETRVKLALSELKAATQTYSSGEMRVNMSPYGVNSEIVVPVSPLRIELPGYDPKTFMRYGDAIIYKFGKQANQEARWITFVNNDLPWVGYGGKIKGVSLEKSSAGLWQLTVSKALEPGHYAVFLKENHGYCWDFDISK